MIVSEHPRNATALTHRAIEAVESGHPEEARTILAEALGLDIDYTLAWLWFAHVTADDRERAFCLLRAASLDPTSAAPAALAKLSGVHPACPPEIRTLVEPPAPPALLANEQEHPTRLPRWAWLAAAAGILILLAGFAAWRPWQAAVARDPIHIAFAADLTGSSADQVEIMRKSVQLRLDQANAEGGIDGRPVTMLVFDDGGTPEAAVDAARRIVADDRIALVIGHRASGQSVAAAPVYREAGIPVITPASTADEVTAINPWGFRTVFDNSSQGVMLAAAIENSLGSGRITLIQGPSLYGRSLSEGVRGAFDGVINETVPYPDEAAIPDVIAAVAAFDNAGTIVLAMEAAAAKPLIVALRDAGIDAPLVSGNTLATDSFLAGFADLPAERDDPGHYTDGLATVAPIFVDSLSGNALRWLNEFRARYGETPSWRGATSHDATTAALHAIDAANVDGLPTPADRRRAIRSALVDLNSPDAAIPGVIGPIWFDSLRTVPQQMAIGIAENQAFKSAPIQFDAYRPTGVTTLKEDLGAGIVISVDGNLLQKQRIVYTGLTVNTIGDLNLADQTFRADFFLWFTYVGDDAPVDIAFNNSVDPMLALGDPIRLDRGEEGVTYQLYRVNATFKAPLEFRDFPFDEQLLPIQFQNRKLPISRIVYVIDRSTVDESQEARLTSSVDRSKTINEIPNWQAERVDIYQQMVGSTSALGDPKATAATSGVEYSVLTTDIVIGRDVDSFLVKNLLPLALLTLVTYVALFVPHGETEVQVSLGVAGILTGAVLLTEVTGSLPDIGYTVAIEWAYYALILLAMAALVVCLVGNRLQEERRFTAVARLDALARVGYPLFVAGVVVMYYVRFHR